MKILNYSIFNKQTTISKQIATKNNFVKSILEITMRDENIYKIYELDNLYTKQNLEYISNIIHTNGELMRIQKKIVKYISNKELKRTVTPVSMTLQDNSNKLYEQIHTNYTDMNSLLILHFSYPKIDKIIYDYLNNVSSDKDIDYQEMLQQLQKKCSFIDIRKFFLLGCNLNSEILFPTEKSKITIKYNTAISFRETNRIPMFINLLMSVCIWGIHILFENNYVKHILFFNPFRDILLLNFRNAIKGCTKIDFFVALPYTDEIVNNSKNRIKYINDAINERYSI